MHCFSLFQAFVQVDRSTVAQIKHVLQDKERLVKRSQLKRSVYRVLGKREEAEDGSHDSHLRSHDEEIYDEDDFYHQLLKDLIERKMNHAESADPVVMGRQWMALQKLRSKVKKKVDTKASKGRKIRYDVHPKLVGFMAPVEQGEMSHSARNDLFVSLFGAHSQQTLKP
ncbi:Protein AATF [Geodia barretti]|uniref:Protein AATF n=1 Tax=Geodia barretti TaxID=519541 RepID=A0AA35S8U4_GEOBA|nr:Protein AATF [Geodia barretti]